MNFIARSGYYVFLTVLILFGLLFVITLIPIPGNIETKIVQSGSMEPAIGTGSVVVVRPTDNYEIGDVVTYSSARTDGENTADNIPVTHRIIEKEVIEGEYYYTTKGDANNAPDPRPVSEQEIIGEVLISIPFLGYILNFARQPLGFILLIGLPAAVIAIDEIIKIYRELTKRKDHGE